MAPKEQEKIHSARAWRKQVAPGVLVVDGDGHVLETEETFEKYIEPEFKAQCPRLVKPYANSDIFFLIDGVFIPDSLWPLRGTYPLGYGALAFRYAGRGDEALHEPGQVDVAGLSINTRLRDMEIEGRDIDVLFPSILLGDSGSNQYRNLPLVSAVCCAYNSWLVDYCRVAPERLKRVAVTCLHDIEAAVREVNRCVTQLGCVAAMIAPANPGDKTLDDPYFYPFYEECQRLDIPICLHISLQWHSDNLQRIVHRGGFPISSSGLMKNTSRCWNSLVRKERLWRSCRASTHAASSSSSRATQMKQRCLLQSNSLARSGLSTLLTIPITMQNSRTRCG